MLKILSVKPLFNKILVTADKYEEDVKENGLVIYTAGTLKEYQKVISIGSCVRDIKAGDLVQINPSRYAVKKYKEDSIRNDLDMNQVITYNFNIVQVKGKDCLLLFDTDVDYIIEDSEETTPSNIIIPDKKIII